MVCLCTSATREHHERQTRSEGAIANAGRAEMSTSGVPTIETVKNVRMLRLDCAGAEAVDALGSPASNCGR